MLTSNVTTTTRMQVAVLNTFVKSLGVHAQEIQKGARRDEVSKGGRTNEMSTIKQCIKKRARSESMCMRVMNMLKDGVMRTIEGKAKERHIVKLYYRSSILRFGWFGWLHLLIPLVEVL